jgi:hypothetical protein
MLGLRAPLESRGKDSTVGYKVYLVKKLRATVELRGVTR